MDQKIFIQLIQDKIVFYQHQIETVLEHNYSTFEKYQQLYSGLEETSNYITSVSGDDIQDMLENFLLPKEEKDAEINYLKSILDLFELNQTKGTTFKLSDLQSHYLDVFTQQVKQLADSSQNVMSEQLIGISDLTYQMKKLKSLLGKIEDEKNTEYILVDDTIAEFIFSLDEDIQQNVLYFILQYNHDLYIEKKKQKQMDERPRLNMEEVKEIFHNFGYDFTDLDHEDQDYLLTYGQIQKLPDIFECFERNLFPVVDLRRNGKKFISILVHSDTQTIEEMITYAKEKDINPFDLLMLVPAIIKQKKNNKIEDTSEYPYVIGRNEDFKKNVSYLEEAGISLSFILQRCKELLIMSNVRLVSNYQKLMRYGLKKPLEEDSTLCSSTLSCLMSNSFDEIIDQFIEMGPDSFQYIQKHFSRVSTIVSPHDLLFYRIYASNRLLDQIELVIDDIDYQGITEENKQEKTSTVDIICDYKEEFDRAIEKHRKTEPELYNLIFNDECIRDLESYIDPNHPLCYCFDGIYISREKVLKIYNILKNEHLDSLNDSLFYAITYNSILSEESINIIKGILKVRGE